MAAQAQFTVVDAMIACGVPNATLFHGSTQAERIATEIFNDDHNSVMDRTFTELNDDLDMYSKLTVAHGQIRLTPGTIRKIKAYMQWGKDMIRVGEDPNTGGFDVNDAMDLLRKHATHLKFITKSKTISETSKPLQFTNTTKWVSGVLSFSTF